jgi:hypothetical protein
MPDEEKPRFRGKSVFTAEAAPTFTDLRAALQYLVGEMVPCRVCGASGAPALRRVFGSVEARAGRQTAEVMLCDDCEPPTGSPFGQYHWGQAHDLPYANALRFVLRHLEGTT